MMTMAQQGLVDVILVSKLDRLGRSLLHLLSLLSECDALGVQVISISEGFDTSTAVGRLQLSILGSVAEFERERIRERILAGLHARAEEGGFVSSRPPFGYRTVADPRGRGLILEIDPEQAATVRRAFELLVVQRIGTKRAVEALNSEGRLAYAGRKWTRGGLIAWARRKGPGIASGTWSYAGIDVPIPPILSASESALMRAWNLATRKGRTTRGPYLLSGIATTPCGATYIGRHAVTATRTQTAIYRCGNRDRTTRADPNSCDCPNMRADAADAAVWDRIVGVLTDPGALAGLRSLKTATTASADRVSVLSGRVHALQAMVAQEYQDALSAGFDAPTARMMVQGRRAELDSAKTELAAAGRAKGAAPMSLDLLAGVIAGRAAELSIEERRDLLELVAAKVEVTEFVTCGNCAGSGREPGTATAEHRFGVHCPRCQGMRQHPDVSIHVELPEELTGFITAEIQAEMVG